MQEEPPDSLDPERAGQLAAIGIVHGQPFTPDPHRRDILEQAARIAAGLARTLLYKPRDRAAYFYDDGSWKTAFVGGSHEFIANGARLLDCRTMMHYVGTGITPAMTHAAVGVGSQYAFTAEDATGAWLDGAKEYTLTLPAGVPAKTFWAIDIYDTQTRSLLQTDNPYPSVNSRFTDVHAEGERGRHHPVRSHSTRHTRCQLAPDHPWKRLVPDPAPLWATAALVRPDLASRGDPTVLSVSAVTRLREVGCDRATRTANFPQFAVGVEDLGRRRSS